MAKPPAPTESEILRTCRRWEIRIDGWRPASLNELLTRHWAGAGRLKRRDRELVAAYVRFADVPRVTGRRRVSLRIILPPKQRRFDIDAFQKSTLDSCVHAGLIRDDHPAWAEWDGVAYVRGAALATTIIIEDV